MNDDQIIQLYFDRSEQAIKETDTKYGGYCYSIAYSILTNPEDAEESVSDTYLSAWNAMPPRRPPALAAFLGKITRNLSIDRWRKYRAFKRGEGQIELALEELRECVSGTESAEEAAIRKEILASLAKLLLHLDLGGDAGMIDAGNPQGVVALHPLEPNQGIL